MLHNPLTCYISSQGSYNLSLNENLLKSSYLSFAFHSSSFDTLYVQNGLISSTTLIVKVLYLHTVLALPPPIVSNAYVQLAPQLMAPVPLTTYLPLFLT